MINFEQSPVFEWNYKSEKSFCVNQGGTSSGKTFSILQVLIVKCLELPNQIVTVVGQDLPNLKSGAIRDLETIFDTMPIFRQFLKSINRTDKIFKFINNSVIEFKSYENEQDAKSGKRQYLFMNEANGIPFSVFEQLQIRTEKQTFIDYNPTFSFWVHDKLLTGREDVDLFISNYRHNPFIKKEIVEKIELLKTTDPNKWKVYGLGMTGELENVVFPSVEWVSKLPEDNIRRVSFGLDFGYQTDPTTVVKCVLSQGKLFGQLLLYKTKLTNQDISKELERIGLKKGRRTGDLIMCDSAEPKSIKELSLLNWNVKPCKKGSDSIRHGIQSLKSYGVLNLVSCDEWKHEQRSYIWQISKKDGMTTNKPISKNDHIWDAFRYAEQGIRKNKIIIQYQ
jgi:phage terminase large subunit